jgi:hypothetical protein
MDASMRAFAKIAIAVAFVSAIVWFGHHGHPHNYGYAPLHAAMVTRIDSAVEFHFRLLPRRREAKAS